MLRLIQLLLVVACALPSVAFAKISAIYPTDDKLYIKGPRDRKSGAELPVPMINFRGEKTGQSVPNGVQVTVSVVDSKGQVYNPESSNEPLTLGGYQVTNPKQFEKPSQQALVKIEFEDPATGKNKTGYIQAKFLTDTKPRSPVPFITPDTKASEAMRAAHLNKIIDRADLNKKDLWCKDPSPKIHSVDDALEEFHNTYCNLQDANSHDQRGQMIKVWDDYIASKQGPEKEWAKKAKQTDIVARTVMFEAHPPGQLDSIHPSQHQCEWDVIALSMRNRAFTCQGYFGCSDEKGDYVSVATKPSQYNIWRPVSARSSFISACFLRQDLKEGKYTNAPSWLAAAFNQYKDAFPAVLERTKKVLNIEEDVDTQGRGNHISDMFRVHSVGSKSASGNANEQETLLRQFHHYYHRGGLGKCFTEIYPDTQYVDAGYVKVTDAKGKVSWALVVDERIQKHSQNKDGTWNFSFKDYGKRKPGQSLPLKYVSANSHLKGKVTIDPKYFDSPNDGYTCLPEGKFPQCFDSPQKFLANENGRRVPTWSLTQDMKDDVARLFGQKNLKMPEAWKKLPPTKGKAIGIECTSPELKPKGGEFPRFKGECDSQFMPMSGS